VNFRVRFSQGALDDLDQLHDFILERDPLAVDLAERAVDAIEEATRTLERFPFACRRAEGATPLHRELVITFGADGYVALFEVDDAQTVTILAVRHQREDDYY